MNTNGCYCLQTRHAASTIKSYYDQILQPSGVTVRQYSLLLNISENSPCTVTKLADLTMLDRSTLARSLRPLFNSGYVADIRDKNARNRSLVLTEKGKETLNLAFKLWQEAQKNIENKFGAEGMKQFLSALNLLNSL